MTETKVKKTKIASQSDGAVPEQSTVRALRKALPKTVTKAALRAFKKDRPQAGNIMAQVFVPKAAKAKPEISRTQAAKPAKKPAPKRVKNSYSGPTVTVRQVGSPIRRQQDQRATLIGLGLNKMGRVSVLQDTPSVRGMIKKIAHMVEIVT